MDIGLFAATLAWVEVEQTVGELRIRPVNEHEAERRRVALDVASGSATRSW